MDNSKPIVGIISPSPNARELFLDQLQEAKFNCLTVEVEQYLKDREDYQTKQLIEVRPQIIIVDMISRETAITTLKVLHDTLPETWLFISAEENNPQLIIETMHAGAREFLPKPSTLEKLAQALERYSTAREKETSRLKGKTYCVTSAKGGAGTTSVAINMAMTLANDASAKVALVDFGSPVGDVAEYLNLKSKYTVSDAFNATNRLDPVLMESFMISTHGVAVMPGNREFHSDLFKVDPLKKVLHVLSETFTHTFIDMACTIDQEQLQAATKFCSAILIILTPELPALWRTDRLIRLFDKTGGSNKIRLVVNRASKKREISTREIEKALGHSIFWSLPNNYPEAINAVNSGKPLVSSSNSRLASSYLELGELLTGLNITKKKRGFLGI